jgi:hypothetical protein
LWLPITQKAAQRALTSQQKPNTKSRTGNENPTAPAERNEAMLSKFDDYPIHQTPEPIAQVATGDRNAYDRYWFNGYAEDGEFYFGIGMAIYPNLGIMDCGFSIVRDGEQHAFHASRRAPVEPTDTQVGPFRIEIIEPMKSLRVVLDTNETGIDCNLVFHPRTACVEETRQTLRRGGSLMMDSTRFAQLGRWQGEIGYAGGRVKIDATRVFGTKDRSWGIRPVGNPDPGGAPATEIPTFFFLWAPIHWSNRCTHMGVFENPDGYQWDSYGMLIPAYESPDDIPGVEDPKVVEMGAIEHRIEYIPGTRRAGAAEIALVERSGTRHEIQLEPLLCFQMKGIGYTHPQWGHGFWKGDLAIAAESWKCADIDPMAIENQHVQQVMRARMGDEVGVGVLEQICFGPHERYGFNEFLDPAK